MLNYCYVLKIKKEKSSLCSTGKTEGRNNKKYKFNSKIENTINKRIMKVAEVKLLS